MINDEDLEYTAFIRGDSKAYTLKFKNYNGRWSTELSDITIHDVARYAAKERALEHAKMRVGIIAKPTKEIDVAKLLTILFKEYFEWGNAHGGKNGMGWDSVHFRMVKSRLNEWLVGSGWSTYYDVNYQDAERFLQRKSKETVKDNRKGGFRQISTKTVDHCRAAMCSFVNWYIKYYQVRGDNPLKGLTGWNKSPKLDRKPRDFTPEEIKSIFKAAPFMRMVVYYTALVTGLRAGEMSLLEDCFYDQYTSLIRIPPHVNKERRDDEEIELPKRLNDLLIKYRKNRGPSKMLFDFDFLRATEILNIDLMAADIIKYTPKGKASFHSFRVTQVNFGLEYGDVKTGMDASRHSTAEVYLNEYARANSGKVLELRNSIIDLIEGESAGASLVHDTENESEDLTEGDDV